ncbi:MAG: hypothetical protein AB7V46_22435 [Thermomicrobiales bacterium]
MDNRESFWQQVEQSVERLTADPVAWQDYQEEVRFFEGGSMDGLVDEEPYYSESEWEEIIDKRSRTNSGQAPDY